MKKQTTLLSVIATAFLLLTSCHGHVRSSSSYSGNSSSNNTSSSDSSSLSSSNEAPRTFTVTWKNEDGLVLEVDSNVLEGTLPTYDGGTPTKPNDAQYNYVFSSWYPEVSEVHADIIYTATYQEELRKYTIVWQDEDGTVLETDENVPYGTLPEFNEADPSKESTAQYDYAFNGWSPEVVTVSGDAIYVASYQEELRKYTITWQDEDGTVLKTEEVNYGETPSYNEEDPTKDSTAQHTYAFNGWSPNIVEVTSDATYVATYLEQVRTYTVTWINYDGTVLEVDEGLEYGASPVFNGEVPSRASIRGADYTFKGWEPEVSPVESDQVYTANYNVDAYFSFDLIDYELEDGYTLNDLRGAPWINSNLQGEINKIKKPSLKDDFYTAVNYDDIKSGKLGPFELDSVYVRDALTAIFDNSSPTTNGAFLKAFCNKLIAGDVSTISDYFANFDLDTYLSSSEVFSSPSSFLQLNYVDGEGYEVEFNDGYIDGSSGLQTLWFYSQFDDYTFMETSADSLVSKMSNILDLNFTNSDISNAKNIDRNLSYQAYYDAYSSNDEYVSYTLNTLPWEQVQDALRSVGLNNDETIVVKDYYVNTLDYLFNYFVINYPDYVEKDIIMRLSFDNRFLLGTNNYLSLCDDINSAYIFYGESGLGYLSGMQLARELTKIAIPAVFEQSYIELEGDEDVKNGVSELIEDVLDGYCDLINDIDWLSASSKRRIRKKLQMMSYVSCYSDFYKNYAKIDDSNLNSTSLFALYNRYMEAAIEQALDYVEKDENAWVWSTMPSYTVNAFYTTSYNSFIILNGIVPAFISDCTEELYGMLGYVIGHEISHAFDSSGSYYDENGYFNDLLTNKDRDTFNTKVDNLIAFYNQITLFENTKVDGERINGEAIADLGGVRVMLQLAKDIPDFDYDRFFRAAARTWCEQPYNDAYLDSMMRDSHPFAYLRANVTFAQFDEFIETYDIGPGDGMYIPKEQRIAIW